MDQDPTERWARASIRFFSQHETGNELASLLGAPASSAHDKGTLASPRNPNSVRHPSSSAGWTSIAARDASLEEHLTSLEHHLVTLDTSNLPPFDEVRLIVSGNPRAFAEGLALSPVLASVLAGLRAVVWLDPM